MRKLFALCQLLYAVVLFSFLEISCSNPVSIKPDPVDDTKGPIARITIPQDAQVSNINVLLFKDNGAGDTVLVQNKLVEGADLMDPITLRQMVGEYTAVVTANMKSYTDNLVLGASYSDLLARLQTSMIPGSLDPPRGWMLGETHRVKIGCDDTLHCQIKRLYSNVIIRYDHLEHENDGINSIVYKIKDQYTDIHLDGSYAGSGQISKNWETIGAGLSVDSMSVLPSIASTSELGMNISYVDGSSRTLSHELEQLLRNYRYEICIDAGGESGVTFSVKAWEMDTVGVILDAAPSANINLDVKEFDPVFNDSIFMQSLLLRVEIEEGVLENYNSQFNFTIEDRNDPSRKLIKQVPVLVKDGYLEIQDVVPLNRGNYRVTDYWLTDVEGRLPDPAGLGVDVDFDIGVSPKIVQLRLHGRQGVENVLMRQIVDQLHTGAVVDGSVFPGAALYPLKPLGEVFPPSNATIKESYWYSNVNNGMLMIPVRGEWRVYSIFYWGNSGKLNGSLPDLFNELLQITSLELPFNEIPGNLPLFTNLSKLTNLLLNNNLLVGNIDRLAPLALVRISLENNDLEGEITTGLQRSRDEGTIYYVSLNNNRFSGPITVVPTNVRYIFVHYNDFTGRMPAYNLLLSGTTAQCELRFNRFTCYEGSNTGGLSRINPQKTGNISRCP